MPCQRLTRSKEHAPKALNMASRTLVATGEPVLPASALGDAVDASSIDLTTGQASLDALLATGAKYSSALVACGAGRASLAPAFLGGVAKLLSPGGKVALKLAAGGVSQVRRGAAVRAAALARPPPLPAAHACRDVGPRAACCAPSLLQHADSRIPRRP
jgi:hypothetical protein